MISERKCVNIASIKEDGHVQHPMYCPQTLSYQVATAQRLKYMWGMMTARKQLERRKIVCTYKSWKLGVVHRL